MPKYFLMPQKHKPEREEWVSSTGIKDNMFRFLVSNPTCLKLRLGVVSHLHMPSCAWNLQIWPHVFAMCLYLQCLWSISETVCFYLRSIWNLVHLFGLIFTILKSEQFVSLIHRSLGSCREYNTSNWAPHSEENKEEGKQDLNYLLVSRGFDQCARKQMINKIQHIKSMLS